MAFRHAAGIPARGDEPAALGKRLSCKNLLPCRRDHSHLATNSAASVHIVKITLSHPGATQSRGGSGRLRFLLPLGVLAGHVALHGGRHVVGRRDEHRVQHMRVAAGHRAGGVAEQRADGGFGIAQVAGDDWRNCAAMCAASPRSVPLVAASRATHPSARRRAGRVVPQAGPIASPPAAPTAPARRRLDAPIGRTEAPSFESVSRNARPASSTSDQRKPSTSPRRQPVRASRRTAAIAVGFTASCAAASSARPSAR